MSDIASRPRRTRAEPTHDRELGAVCDTCGEPIRHPDAPDGYCSASCERRAVDWFRRMEIIRQANTRRAFSARGLTALGGPETFEEN